MLDTTRFQYCQKIVVFRNNDSEILLAKRKGEADYNEMYTFIGGKMETTDRTIVEGLLREKCEEVGTTARIRILPLVSYNLTYVKKDGGTIILPHYYAEYIEGEIVLSDDEYSDYAWVRIDELAEFEPKIESIPDAVAWVKKLKSVATPADFVEI